MRTWLATGVDVVSLPIFGSPNFPQSGLLQAALLGTHLYSRQSMSDVNMWLPYLSPMSELVSLQEARKFKIWGIENIFHMVYTSLIGREYRHLPRSGEVLWHRTSTYDVLASSRAYHWTVIECNISELWPNILSFLQIRVQPHQPTSLARY